MITLSKRAQQLMPSATLKMAAKAAQLCADGIDVISFSTGEPDFDTPAYIKDAAKASLDRGFTKYTPVPGIPKLRAAIADKLKRDNGLAYAPSEITVTSGAKQAIGNALLAMVDPGNEVIVPAPYWVSYPAQVKLAGGTPVYVDTTATGMKLTPERLEQAITDRTKVLLFNSPCNPSGVVYTREELASLAQICIDKNIAVISDEIYEHLIYDGERHTSIVSVDERMRERTIIVNGVSKCFSMAGWRLGWGAGPEEVIAKMTQLAGQQTSCATSFVQEAAVAAVEGPMDEVHEMVGTFKKRRDLMFEELTSIPGITVQLPPGTFYLLPDVQAYLGKRYRDAVIEDDTALAETLLTEAHIATVAGTPFGAPGYLRFSFATSMENITEGMKRLKRLLTEVH